MEAPQTIRTDTATLIGQRVRALRAKLDEVYSELLAGTVGPDTLEHLDWCLLEWRWVESQIARQAVQLDHRSTAVIVEAAGQPAGEKSGFLQWFRPRFLKVPTGPHSGDGSAVLVEVIAQSHELLLLLFHYREFMQAQLLQQEAELAGQFDCLNGIAVGAGASADKVTNRIEMMQDLVDGTIGMISSANLLYNKIMVDAEASILALTSIGAGLAPYSALRQSLLETLFQRAERGLLSVEGIAHRKAVIDEAFQRKLSMTRQVTG